MEFPQRMDALVNVNPYEQH